MVVGCGPTERRPPCGTGGGDPGGEGPGGGGPGGGAASSAALMGVYEEAPLHHFGMHWQQHERYAGPAHDPSRDLSPNLPVHSCGEASAVAAGDTETSSAPLTSSSGSSSTSSSSSSSSTSSGGGSGGGGGGGSACSTPNGGGGGGGRYPHPPQQTTPTPLLRPKIEPGTTSGPPTPTGNVAPGGGPPPAPAPDAAAPSDVVCGGCGGRITDRFYLLAVDRRWHAACLKCCECKLPLDSELTCFARDGNIYCKDDYYRLFGMKRCGRCHAAILSSELVMRARDLVFHVPCFCCAACGAPLTKGDHFGLRDGAVLCRLHFELATAAASPEPVLSRLAAPPPPPVPPPAVPPPPPPPPPAPFPAFPTSPHHPHHHHHFSPHPHHPGDFHPPPLPPGAIPPGPACAVPDPSAAAAVAAAAAAAAAAAKVPYFNGAPAPGASVTRQKGRPRKRKPKDLEAMTASLDLNADYLDVPFRGGGGPGGPGGMPGSNGQQRTKRMRTSFKHHQLRTMKSYFAINHNPDAKDLKQLSQKTGLPKRVLQVWFQNARAKWRRMVLKQESKGGDKCPDGGGGGAGGGGGSAALGDLDPYPPPPHAGEYHHHHHHHPRGGLGPHSPPFILGGSSPPPLECS